MKSNKNLFSFLVLLAIALVQFASPQAVRAAVTRYVASDGVASGTCSDWANACTLHQALSVAAAGDELWVEQGTYIPTTPAGRDATFTMKEIALYGGFAGTETARSQRNTNPALTILSGEIGSAAITDNVKRIVSIDNISSAMVMDGFTVTLGYVADADGNPYGAGFYITNSSPTLTNLNITNNQAGNTIGSGGGGMYIADTNVGDGVITPHITNVTFTGNQSGRGGGLFSQNSDPVLESVTFTSNIALATGGGGMNSQTVGTFDPPINPVLTNVAFINNSATGGGGLFIGNSTGHLTNVTFSGNIANRRGGGLLLEFSSAVLTNVTFYNNTSNNNLADPKGGGGLMNIAGSPTLNNVTFSGNTSNANGVDGGAMRSVKEADPGAILSNPVIRNSIFWDNNSTELTTDGTGTVTISDSVVEGGCPAGGTCTNIITTDPKLGALASNGGYTQTMAIVAQGSAIDKGGVNSACAATDQRGISRPKGEGCDIGAYERVTSVLAAPNTALTSWPNTFTWTGIDNATWYYLDIYTSTDVFVFRQWYKATETNCSGSTACSFSPVETASLANGSYKWRILDFGDTYGYGGWSAFTNFSLTGACYTLTTIATPAGGGSINNSTSQNCAGGYVDGTIVQLAAVPNTGYVLDSWSGDAGGSSNSVSITMDANKSVTANFRGVTLNSPSGAVSSWDHTFDWTGHAAATWYLVQVQTSTDTPVFMKWYTAAAAGCSGGSGCTVTPDETLSLANGSYKWRVLDYGGYGYGSWTGFTNFSLSATCYTLTTNIAGSGTINTSAQNCGGGYTAGTIVQLTAVPNAGFIFNSWSGDATGTTNPTSITMDANKSVTAIFQGVTLFTPSGPQDPWNNIFSWWTGHAATWYLLQVLDANDATVHLQWYRATETGCPGGSTCSVSPEATLNLATGSYKWRILDYGEGYGYGNWTNFLNFSVP